MYPISKCNNSQAIKDRRFWFSAFENETWEFCLASVNLTLVHISRSDKPKDFNGVYGEIEILWGILFLWLFWQEILILVKFLTPSNCNDFIAKILWQRISKTMLVIVSLVHQNKSIFGHLQVDTA